MIWVQGEECAGQEKARCGGGQTGHGYSFSGSARCARITRRAVFRITRVALETVIVAGQIVVEERRLTTIDEVALRQTVEDVMPGVRADLEIVTSRIDEISPFLLDAWRRSWREDISLERYAGRHRE